MLLNDNLKISPVFIIVQVVIVGGGRHEHDACKNQYGNEILQALFTW